MKKKCPELLKCANKHLLPVTFRAAGAVCPRSGHQRLHIDCCRKALGKYTVSPDATQITLQPGIIGQRVNEISSPTAANFRPIRLRSKSAMVGGIVMNNASGMNCGTHANSDKVLHSARMVFADGTILNTGDAESRRNFTLQSPKFIRR